MSCSVTLMRSSRKHIGRLIGRSRSEIDQRAPVSIRRVPSPAKSSTTTSCVLPAKAVANGFLCERVFVSNKDGDDVDSASAQRRYTGAAEATAAAATSSRRQLMRLGLAVGIGGALLLFDLEALDWRAQNVDALARQLRDKYAGELAASAKMKKEVSPPVNDKEDDNNSSNEEKNETTKEAETETETEESDAAADGNKQSKVTFRSRKIIQYENRIRQYSTPDKVFRYFATIKVWNEKLSDYEVFMRPEDFVRSLTFGAKQPEGLGLDSYNKFDPQMQKLESTLDNDSVFRRLSKYGLISFTDYIFLVTLLSTPNRHFEIAFRMFDVDGNGNIDLDEWGELQSIIRNNTSLGKRHRDTFMTGSVIRDNSILNQHFFGEKLDQLLPVAKFLEFQRELQDEVIKMEFNSCESRTRSSDGQRVISEAVFCELILAYAGLPPAQTKKMLKNINNMHPADDRSPGITLKEYETFFRVLRSIHDIDTALKFYSIAGASIDKTILKHVSKTVAHVDLSDHLVQLVFDLFDDNGDGKLSHKEFIKVMKRRWLRGLQNPKDTGFVKLIDSFASCSREALFGAPH